MDKVGLLDLFYEDIVIGEDLLSATHVLTGADIAIFADVTRDHHPLHFDDHYARSMGFPGVIAHGLFGLSLMEGLKSEMKLYEHTSIASLGWDKVRFLAPIYVGDTLQMTVRFVEKRLSSEAGRGIVTEVLWLRNQHGDVVTEGWHASLLLCRDPSAAVILTAPSS